MAQERTETIAVFMDTNIFYDYESPEKIKWTEEIFPCAKLVRIVITPHTITELNQHKDTNAKPMRRERAGSLLKLLRQWTKNSDANQTTVIRPNVEIFFEVDEPNIEPPFRDNVQDDHLICSILRYKSQNPDQRAILFTSDNGMGMTVFMRAKKYGVEQQELPDKYKSPLPEDEQAKEIKQLKLSIEKLQQQFPVLSCALFDNEHNRESAPVRIIEPMATISHKKEIADLRNMYPLIPTDRLALGLYLAEFDLGMMTYSDVDKNNAEIQTFYQTMEDYYKDLVLYEYSLKRTVECSFGINNSGSKPATCVESYFYFPANCSISEIPLMEPCRPSIPSLFVRNRRVSSRRTTNNQMPSLPPRAENVSLLSVLRTDEHFIAQYSIERLKHERGCRLPDLYCVIPPEIENELLIGYKLIANETPASVNSTFSVRLTAKAVRTQSASESASH